MIKEWATVVSRQNGLATVSCDVKASCSSCASRAGCGSRVLNKLGPQTTHTIVVPCDEPLTPGQKLNWALPKVACSVRRCWSTCLRWRDCFFSRRYSGAVWFRSCGIKRSSAGGVGGFLIARGYSRKLAEREARQPVILNVALPPDLIRVETQQ